MNPRHRPDLDLQLPFHDGPGFPPPILDMEQDLRFIEINREILRENGTLADIIANRPRPVEEMFVMK